MFMTAMPTTLPSSCTDEALLNDWHPVGFASDFPIGELKPVQLLGRELVVWRSADGQVHVWEDLCVHRGTRLSLGRVEGDTVVCPYHGWRYAVTGQCVATPAAPYDPPMKKARAFPYLAKERYDMVWACLGTPRQDVPAFAEWDDASFRRISCGPWAYNATGYRAIENFMDATHLPFVHAGLNGLADKPDVIEPYDVNEDASGELWTSEIKTFQPFGDPRNIPVYGYYAYRVMRPLAAYFCKRVVIVDEKVRAEQGKDDDRFCIMLTAQPVDDTHCIVRQAIVINFKRQPTDEEIRARQDLVIGQDRAIVESQRPQRIPVDLRFELHHRTDLLGQRYRKWLSAQGITYGVC
jgi:phenylpropionate dioxygenase-like ring-hydroxylating dioxygenase large terminal subunit